jgi:hypothetical protein
MASAGADLHRRHCDRKRRGATSAEYRRPRDRFRHRAGAYPRLSFTAATDEERERCRPASRVLLPHASRSAASSRIHGAALSSDHARASASRAKGHSLLDRSVAWQAGVLVATWTRRRCCSSDPCRSLAISAWRCSIPAICGSWRCSIPAICGLLQEAADGRLRRWVYGRRSLCLSPSAGDSFRLRHSAGVWVTDLNRSAP